MVITFVNISTRFLLQLIPRRDLVLRKRAGYVAVTKASKELIRLQGLLTELGFIQNSVLYSDSQRAIHLEKNSTFHSRTKHIGLYYHFIKSFLQDQVLTLRKNLGSKNPTNMLTKVVTIDKLKLRSTSIGMLE